MYYKGEFMVLHPGYYFYDKIISVFSLESTTSGCVYTTRGSLTWAAISTITSLAYFL